jgi:hypothetical protein
VSGSVRSAVIPRFLGYEPHRDPHRERLQRRLVDDDPGRPRPILGACRKVVRELRQMTEPEARALLASPPTEGLCVRYVHDATGEILFRRDDVVPVGKLLRRAAAVALAVALPVGSMACMGAAPALTGSPANVPVAPSASAPLQVVMGAPPAPPPAPSSSPGSGE